MASTIKVDNVQNQPGTNIINKCSVTTTIGAGAGETINVCGATVNIGRCGGTVALAAGATQSGFGRTGTVDWDTTPKVTGDSPVTGVSGVGYFMNTTGGAIILNLPAGSAGDIISVQDYLNTFDTYGLNLVPNGSEKINGGAAGGNLELTTEGQGLTLVYVDGTIGWRSIEDGSFTDTGAVNLTATVSGACNTLTTSGNCKIATFVNPGTFCVSQLATCASRNTVSYMVVAGGGGGASPAGLYAGGGGAGGFREYKSPATPYTASPLDGNPGGTAVTVTATAYPICIGGGGAVKISGTPSTFSTITSTGGGNGGNNSPPVTAVGSGGSGGGLGYWPPGGPGAGGAGNTPPTTPPQGNGGAAPGGVGAGGGGGATAGGSGGPSCANGGPGGAGATTSIPGSPTAYAGGGGGSAWKGTGGTGGVGGGGNGSTGGTCAPTPAPQTAGADNTGGGGGSGGSDAGSGPAANSAGGSGIVVIRYRYK